MILLYCVMKFWSSNYETIAPNSKHSQSPLTASMFLYRLLSNLEYSQCIAFANCPESARDSRKTSPGGQQHSFIAI